MEQLTQEQKQAFELVKDGKLKELKSYLKKHPFLSMSFMMSQKEGPATPLYQATSNGDSEMVEFLLSRGVLTCEGTGYGKCPIHRAAELGNQELIDIFTREGNGPLSITDKLYYRTAASWALSGGHPELVLGILKKTHFSRRQDFYGMTLLHQASAKGYTDLVVDLLKINPQAINDKDNFGRTAAHWAAEEGHLETLKALYAYCVDLDAKENSGETVKDLAKSAGHKEILAFLKEVERGNMTRNMVKMAVLAQIMPADNAKGRPVAHQSQVRPQNNIKENEGR